MPPAVCSIKGKGKLLRHNCNTGVGDSAVSRAALQRSNRSLDTFVAHHVGVLNHRRIQAAFVDQFQNVVGAVEANADHIRAALLDRVANADRGRTRQHSRQR